MSDPQIYIELDGGQRNFQAGSIIKGKIHVDYTNCNEHTKSNYDNLKLTLYA